MVIQILGTLAGAAEAISGLARLDDNIKSALVVGVGRGAQGAVSVVRGNASGRPGPRVITGAFRRSINSASGPTGDGAVGRVGTNAVQGARLEFGFVGPDALGRVYNQPPYPYLQPSIPEVAKISAREVVSALRGALG